MVEQTPEPIEYNPELHDPPPVLNVHKAALQEIDSVVGNERTLDEDDTARLRGILFAALSEEHGLADPTYNPGPATTKAITDAWRASDYADLIPLEFLIPVAEIAERALATAGRLLPTPVEIRTEWGVWWHSGDSDGIVLDEEEIGSRERADRRGKERIGEYGITRYTLHHCEHRRYPDGSEWISTWELESDA